MTPSSTLQRLTRQTCPLEAQSHSTKHPCSSDSQAGCAPAAGSSAGMNTLSSHLPKACQQVPTAQQQQGRNSSKKEQQQRANSSKGRAAAKETLAAAALWFTSRNQGYTVCKIFTTHRRTVTATIAKSCWLHFITRAPLHNHEIFDGHVWVTLTCVDLGLVLQFKNSN